MPTSDVLQMYLQEKYQCQGKYNGYKHQHPSGKNESFLSHNTCGIVAVGYRKKETNQCSVTMDLLIQISRHDPYLQQAYRERAHRGDSGAFAQTPPWSFRTRSKWSNYHPQVTGARSHQ